MNDYKEAYEHLQKEYKKLDLSYGDMREERDGLASQIDFYKQKIETVETRYIKRLSEDIELLQENSRLKIKIKSLNDECNSFSLENLDLKVQIKKMKNSMNCKTQNHLGTRCPLNNFEDVNCPCNKWEMEE